MAGEKKETHSFYVILGIVAIVAIVGIVSILGNKKLASTEFSTDIVNEIDDLVVLTASMSHEQRDNCLSITERPCYMKIVKGPRFNRLGTGAENAYETCLQNPVLTGEALFWSVGCADDKKERVHFCYQGHGFAIYYLNGECV